jgi:hypothetical protein
MYYYEIIGGYTGKVIGVCSSQGIFDVAEEEPKATFGKISEEEFNNFENKEWLEPVSLDRYKVVLVPTLIEL